MKNILFSDSVIPVIKKIQISNSVKDVAYSPDENNGQNSFYKNFLVILHVNAP